MSTTQVTFSKTIKLGLPNYSNITVGLTLTVDVAEGEKIDYDKTWDEINQQLQIQSETVDPSWITRSETKKDWKFTVRAPKNSTNQEKIV